MDSNKYSCNKKFNKYVIYPCIYVINRYNRKKKGDLSERYVKKCIWFYVYT